MADQFKDTFLHDIANYGNTEEPSGGWGYATYWQVTTLNGGAWTNTFLHDIANYGETGEPSGGWGYATLWTKTL